LAYDKFEEWKYEVDRQFRIRTLCTCIKLRVDAKAMTDAFTSGKSPVSFVTRWIKKYRLTDCSKR
jgi:hypothetical protein